VDSAADAAASEKLAHNINRNVKKALRCILMQVFLAQHATQSMPGL